MYIIYVHNGCVSGRSCLICAFNGNACISNSPLRLSMLTFGLREGYYTIITIIISKVSVFMLPKVFMQKLILNFIG